MNKNEIDKFKEIRDQYPVIDKIITSLTNLNAYQSEFLYDIVEALRKQDAERIKVLYAALCTFNNGLNDLKKSTEEAKQAMTAVFAETEKDMERLNKMTDDLWINLKNKEKVQH